MENELKDNKNEVVCIKNDNKYPNCAFLRRWNKVSQNYDQRCLSVA